MALIVITISDSNDGNVEIGVQSEPRMDTRQSGDSVTAAQVLASQMLTLANNVAESDADTEFAEDDNTSVIEIDASELQ